MMNYYAVDNRLFSNSIWAAFNLIFLHDNRFVCDVHAQEAAVITPESTELYVDLEQVSPGLTPEQPPSDAIVLFDGTDLTAWQAMQLRIAGDMPGMVKSIADYEPGKVTEPAQWAVADGIMTVEPRNRSD